MRYIIFFYLIFFVPGCGYRMGNLTPEGINSIYVPTFQNTTLFRDFEFDFTTAVVDEILVKTSLQVVPEYAAETVLHGTIIDVALQSIIKNDDREAELINVTIVVEIEWLDTRTNSEVIPKQVVSHNFEVNFEEGENFADETTEGFADLARRVVYTLENKILFYDIR